MLVLGVESAAHPVESRLAELTDARAATAAAWWPPRRDGRRDAAADAWRSSFLRDALRAATGWPA